MFDIGWSELLVIGVVALIAIGPKELPGVLRAVGQWMGKIKRMAAEFQGQFQEAMREAEMADIKKQVDEATNKLSADFDPLGTDTWKPAEEPPKPEMPAADEAPAPAAETPAAEPTHADAAPPEPAEAHAEAPADGRRGA